MTRSSFAVRTIGLGLLLAGNFACGGEAPPAKPPETPSTSIDAGETPAPATEADAGTTATPAATPEPAPAPAPAVLALPAAAAKLKVKTTKDFELEVKSDGTVNSGGKATA